ncbi:MAG TPA: cytochrome c3 family protein [Kineobactrum sp.]
MYFLVRKLTGRGSAEALETEYQGDTLTLGGDTGAMVPLPGFTGGIAITATGGGSCRVSARKPLITVNDATTTKATVNVGDQFTLPGYALTVIPPPPGFDFALQLVAQGKPASVFAGDIGLDGRTWNLRRASWILALLVLAVGLVIPALGLFSDDVADTLRSTPLPDDGLWSSGPLVAAHQASGVALECQACHEEPFVMVKDGACLDCHRGTNEHADLAVYEAHHFADVRCASCHREHNEPALISRRDKGLCVDCHTDPGAWEVPGQPAMSAVNAFTGAGHPEFRLALLEPQGPGGAHGWDLRRVLPSDDTAREHSNLKFNHEIHLDASKVQHEGTGAALDCASCHTPKEDGEHFEPITMDAHCRSCHGLNFDMFEPELELPHGDLRAAIVAMEAHFIREFTDPELRRQRAADKPRRLPGKRDSVASCEGSGLDCGRAEALKEAQYQFADSGCITCHEVLETGLADINDRWFVEPVKLTGDWFPHARFDHSSHLSQALDSADQVCETCHEASVSSVATDILMPAQDNCLGCHAEGKGAAALDCVSCHAFHQDGGTLSRLARDSAVLQGNTP